MPKEKPQPKNSESQALEMARQTLGRVKEIDLTAEQKEKVLAMIDQAKAAEKVNPSQAINIYQVLKKYLDDIKLALSGEMLDDLEMIRTQLLLVDMRINEISDKISSAKISMKDLEYLNKMFAALKLQKNVIIQARKLKTEIRPNNEVEITALEILTEKQVWEEIKKREKLSDADLYLDKKIVDEEGDLLYLNLGVVGKPEIELEYFLAAKYRIDTKRNSVEPRTILGKTVNFKDILRGGRTVGVSASYNEDKHIWEPEI